MQGLVSMYFGVLTVLWQYKQLLIVMFFHGRTIDLSMPDNYRDIIVLIRLLIIAENSYTRR